MHNLLTLVCICLLIDISLAYGRTISMTTNTASDITNFYQNFAYCSCNIMPSLCDNYCCCDTSCASSSIRTWTTAKTCLTTTEEIQDFCNQTTTKGYGAFNQLACVYYSNRGTIGYYYQYLTTSSISLPTPSKFLSSIATQTIQQTFYSSAISSVTLNSAYSSTNPYLVSSTTEFFYVLQPGPGGNCILSPLNVTRSGSSSCNIFVSSCSSLNNITFSSTNLCATGDCTSQSSVSTITSSGNTTCSGVITGMNIVYTISSSQSTYTLSISSFQYITSNSIPQGQSYTFTLTHTITTPTQKSGNPGYQLAKSITLSQTIKSITDSSGYYCATDSNSTGTVDILFGQPIVLSCYSSSSCNSTLYIDTLLTTTFNLQKYASKSTDTITMSGTTTTSNCNYQGYLIQIIYSYAGWELDPQYYIVGAKIIPSLSPDSPTAPNQKYLQISWTYVNPETITSPPSNTFYEYFNALWTPLRQKFGLQ